MKQAIIEKINAEIQRGIKNEPQVLYILVQCRKYLETCYPDERRFKYPTISLMGDWVLHSRLTGQAAKDKLKEYGDFFASEKENDDHFEFMKSGFTLFKDLRREVISLSHAIGLDESLTSKKTWLKFVRYLCRILKDLPLQGEGDVKEFKFEDGFIIDDHETISFAIYFQNGRNIHSTVDIELV